MEPMEAFMENNTTPITTDPRVPQLSGDLYRETFEQILKGLISGIKQHNGRLDQVTMGDILDNCDVNPITLDYYWKSPKSIMDEAIFEMKKIMQWIEQNIAGFAIDDAIQLMLRSLAVQPLLLEAVLISGNQRVWESGMKKIVQQLAERELDNEAGWTDIYPIFCAQLQSVLQKWQGLKLSDDEVPHITRLLQAWIAADREYLRLTSGESAT